MHCCSTHQHLYWWNSTSIAVKVGILSDVASKLSAHSLEAVSVNYHSIVVFLVTFTLRSDAYFTVAI